MNSTIFWRLVWKEYRLQRALWIAIGVLGALIQLWVLAIHRFGEGVDPTVFVTILYGAALVFTWIYAMGCGAVLFAAERENGTYDLQRALPVLSRQVFGAKFVFALVSTAALLGVLLLLAALLAGWTRPPAETLQMQWGMIGLASLEVLAWTILFSLLLHGPLKAAILGVAAASFVTYYLLSHKLGGATALGSRAMVVMIVGLVDYVLGRRWFRDSTRSSSNWALWTGRLASLWPAGVPALPSRSSILGRLAWQHWRDSGWILGILFALATLAALPAAMVPPNTMLTDASLFDAQLNSVPAAQMRLLGYWGFLYLGTMAASLLGVYAFRADQRGASFRFLADRGVSPRMVWFSRQLTWLCLVALGTLVLLLLAMAWAKTPRVAAGLPSSWAAAWSDHLPIFHAGRVLLMVILACALGQLCAMLLRSGILAAVFAVASSVLAVAWAGIMASFQMNWLWSVAPIPVALFLATWLRAPGWMAERNRLRDWLGPGLALAVPALGLLTAVALVRAYEVPDVAPGFSREEYSQPASPEAVETAQMYLRALDLYVSWNAVHTDEPVGDSTSRIRKPADQGRREAAMLEANRESLAITLAATHRPTCDFLAQSELFVLPEGLVSPETPRRPHPGYLATLVAMSARSLQRTGDLEEARERWLAELRLSSHLRQRGAPLFGADAAIESEALGGLTDWAAQPGQSSQKVLAALRGLDRILAGLPSPRGPIKSAYWHARQRLLEQPAPRSHESLVMFWLHSLPWERERTRRVLNQLAATGLGVVNDVIGQMAGGKNPRLERFSSNYEDWWRDRPWTRNTFLDDCYSRGSRGDYDFVVHTYARAEAQRRATRIGLALQAWRLDHNGQLPQSLDALQGKYLEQIPLDPCSGEPFRYYAEGWPTTLTPQQPDYWSLWPAPIAAHTPFVWGIGSIIELGSVSVVSPDMRKLDRYRIGGYQRRRSPSCEEDLLVYGWGFPVPKAKNP